MQKPQAQVPLNVSGNVDWPTCAICLSHIDMSKELQGWQCENKHSTVICNNCFIDLPEDKCPNCRAAIPNTKDIRSFRRRLGLKSMALKIAENIKKLGQLGQKYSAPEIRNVFVDRLLEKAQESGKTFLKVLRTQAESIVAAHYMIESKEEEEELKELDLLMMIVESHERTREHPIGKLMYALKMIVTKRALEKIQEQHKNAIIIQRGPQDQQEE